MKKYIYGALIGIILTALILSAGGNTNGAPVLAYVYSNSMEPLIKVDDAFFVWPSSELRLGDIIMYRPVVLKAAYITHRIIAFGENGYITKGDNSYYKDQDSGEPEVVKDRIIGKVITVNGQPVIIPGLGKFPAAVRTGLGRYSIYLAGVFFLIGIIMLLAGKRSAIRKRKSGRRLRLRHIYKSAAIFAALAIMLSIYLGSRVSQIKYLVSEYPGTLGDQIEVNHPGKLTMVIKNNGLIPVWTIMKGVKPLSVQPTPEYIYSRSSKTIVIDVSPQHKTGVYQGYVQIYNYPVFLPQSWILFLHKTNPILAVTAVGLSAYLVFTLCFLLIKQIHGFEAWIPLRAIRDKFLKRRIEQEKARLLGRRRSR